MLISVADIQSSNAAKSIFSEPFLEYPLFWRTLSNGERNANNKFLHTIPQVGCVFYIVQCGHVHLPSGLSAAAMFTSATDYSSGRSVAKPLIITSECQTYDQIGSEMTALCVRECEVDICVKVFLCVCLCVPVWDLCVYVRCVISSRRGATSLFKIVESSFALHLFFIYTTRDWNIEMIPFISRIYS